MKQTIADLLLSAISQLQAEKQLPTDLSLDIKVENTRDKSHGDFATNIALMLAKPTGMPPRKIAEMICKIVSVSGYDSINKTEIAGPGFINFFVNEAQRFEVIDKILQQGPSFGRGETKTESFQVEFVSANPTGPLHVGHGRGAAYGASVADLLEAAGYQVQREYYVNDAGRQMNILAASVWLRYLSLFGEDICFPSNGYKGEYVKNIALEIQKQHDEQFRFDANAVFAEIPADEPQGGDKEVHIDALIDRCKNLLGPEAYLTIFNAGLQGIVSDIQNDLSEFGVHYQNWFSEKSLQASIDDVIQRLTDKGHIYEEKGALWFRSTTFGDDKDRVVKRDNGETTYFASDIAYHLNKFERGFDKVINIWGADHHGYIPRVKAALQALEIDPDRLIVKLVQFAILYRGSERVQMSTRSGSFVTLRALRDEVGNDAARFFYVTRKAEQHMDFDLELAKSQSKDNPVYYIQYAHARICSVLRKLEEESDVFAPVEQAALDILDTEVEKDLATFLGKYPEVIENAANQFEPHQLTHYLRDLASHFHSWYNSEKVLVEDKALRYARLTLSLAVRQVLKNGLSILGVSAPEQM
jgi:arginyl-tRNA synthetase